MHTHSPDTVRVPMGGDRHVDERLRGFDESPYGRRGDVGDACSFSGRQACSESSLVEGRPRARDEIHTGEHTTEGAGADAMPDLVAGEARVERLAPSDQMKLAIGDAPDEQVRVHGSFPWRSGGEGPPMV